MKTLKFVTLLSVIFLSSCYRDQTPPCEGVPYFQGTVKKVGDCGWAIENDENYFPYFPDIELPVAHQTNGLRLRVYVKKYYESYYSCNATYPTYHPPQKSKPKAWSCRA